MRAVIVHQPNAELRELRRAVHGLGYECEQTDCVASSELARRLARGVVDLVIVKIDKPHGIEQEKIKEAWALTTAPKLAVGPANDRDAAATAENLGVIELVDAANLNRTLDGAFERLYRMGHPVARRGHVIAVFAPTAGSGCTTVSANLAAALVTKQAPSVALLELRRAPGDMALLLNLEQKLSAEEVCRRWKELDQVSLRNSFVEHPSGLRVLANRMVGDGNSELSSDAARKLAILSRIMHTFTVAALGSYPGEETFEVMTLSDFIVLVVRPDVPAMRRAQWACTKAEEAGISRKRMRLVVNRWGQRGQLSKEQIESSLEMSVVEVIPDDPALANRAANEGKLLSEVGRAKIIRHIDSLAKKLMQETVLMAVE
jgi:Flp pilus assembly CpaE family ATPase